MNKASLKVGIICGPVGFNVFGIGYALFSRFFPPISPAWDAVKVSAFYNANAMGIGIGSLLVMFSAALFYPFYSAMFLILRRMEGENAVFSFTVLNTTAFNNGMFLLGGMFHAITAFRPDRSAELTMALNDIGWIVTCCPTALQFVYTLAIALAIFSDKSAIPLMPRWSGYASVWMAFLYLPGMAPVLFKTGPFAWDGMLAFWIPAIVSGLWSYAIAFCMWKAVPRM